MDVLYCLEVKKNITLRCKLDRYPYAGVYAHLRKYLITTTVISDNNDLSFAL